MLLFCRLRSSQMDQATEHPIVSIPLGMPFTFYFWATFVFPVQGKPVDHHILEAKGFVVSSEWRNESNFEMFSLERIFPVAKHKKLFAKFSFTISIINKWNFFELFFIIFWNKKKKGFNLELFQKKVLFHSTYCSYIFHRVRQLIMWIHLSFPAHFYWDMVVTMSVFKAVWHHQARANSQYENLLESFQDLDN